MFAWYSIQRFNAAFTRALSWAELTHFLVLIPISLRSILILASHLRLGLPEGLFPVGVPAHLNLIDFVTLTILGELYKLWCSSLWSLLHSSSASLLGPNIRDRTLFSNTLSLRSTLNVRDHASQPYSTTGNIIALNIIYYIINTWSKIFGLFFTKIARTEECEIWHSCRWHREWVQNANIFLKIMPTITIINHN